MNKDNKNFRFSLIIPVKNAEQYILSALNSIANQNYDNIEILIIDDNSTDNSKAIVENFKRQHPTIEISTFKTTDGKRGPGAARNVGLDNARGKYILFLDADDVLNEGALESIDKAVLDNPDSDIFVLGYQMTRLNSKEEKINTINLPAGKIQESRLYQIGVNTAGSIWNNCIKNSIFNGKNKIRFKENCIFEDLPTKIQLFTMTKRNIKSVTHMTHTQYVRPCKSVTGNVSFRDMKRLIDANKEVANLKPNVDKKDKMYINIRMAMVPALLAWFTNKCIQNKIDRIRSRKREDDMSR